MARKKKLKARHNPAYVHFRFEGWIILNDLTTLLPPKLGPDHKNLERQLPKHSVLGLPAGPPFFVLPTRCAFMLNYCQALVLTHATRHLVFAYKPTLKTARQRQRDGLQLLTSF